MLLDIVILPPAKLREKIAKQVMGAVKGCRYDFVVDNQKLIPHMSLFHINTSHVQELVAKVKEVIKSDKPTMIYCSGVEVYGDIIGLKLSNNEALQRLNKKIVENCYRLRIGTMPWNGTRKPTALEERKRKKYGTQHNIGKSFDPHFTLVRLRRIGDVKKVSERLTVEKFNFLSDTIAICQVNPWHQVTRILKKFKLKRA